MAKPDIQSVEEQGTFEEIVATSVPSIRAIATALRALIAEVHPGVTEVPWGRQKNIGYGIGPKKQSEHYAYIFPQSGYVNLGFMQGTELPDPSGLLEGGGKSLRHVKVHSLDEVKAPALRSLLEEALALRRRAVDLGRD